MVATGDSTAVWKASYSYNSKVHASSHENLICWKIQHLREQNYEVEAHNKALDKADTKQSYLNSKYLSSAVMLNILILLFASVFRVQY